MYTHFHRLHKGWGESLHSLEHGHFTKYREILIRNMTIFVDPGYTKNFKATKLLSQEET